MSGKKISSAAALFMFIFLSGCQQSVNPQSAFQKIETIPQSAAVAPTTQQTTTANLNILPSTEQAVPTQETSPLPAKQISSLVSAMKQLPDYGLFLPTSTYDNNNNATPDKIAYYDDGTVTSGKYSGYRRVFAFGVPQEGPGLYNPGYLFMTKDNKNFVSDSANYSSGYNDTKDSTIFDLSKVVAGDKIPLDLPQTITSGGTTLTFENSFPWLPAGVTELKPSIQPGLRFFTAEPRGSLVPTDTTGYNAEDIKNLKLEDKYVSGDAFVYAVDQNGLVYQYGITADLTSAKPVSKVSIYPSYGILFIQGCGFGDTFMLKGITENDLKPAATMNGIQFYTLSDVNHPLNKAEYFDKITEYVSNPANSDTQSGFTFADINPDPAHIKQPPTFQEYAAKNPVLVYKDAWGRYVGLGETYYYLPGGCGKPVIYLYPQTPTAVTVKLVKPTTFTTDIPTYDNQWKVLAQPDGELTDLQPSATDCSSFDAPKFGSEYAAEACKTGRYPYLFWSGNTASAHPKQDTGWIVSSADLQGFLQEKMAAMGYTDQETADMTSYWVPEMLGKNAPYFRISFLQTAQMNQFIPLEVTPKPQTMLRMFMDWVPLTQKPVSPVVPETLEHVARNGFTLVEWGGLKQ